MANKLSFGRYDFAIFYGFICYALCSLAIPLTLVEIGKTLDFPLDAGGMSAGGGLHFMRCVAMVITILSCSFIVAKIGKRYSMGLSMLCIGGGVLCCALSQSYWTLFPCLLIAGLGEGVCEGIATPFVQDLHPQAPERYVNIAHSMWSVGIAMAVVIAGWLLTIGVNWRIILGICGVMTLLSCLFFVWRENPLKRYPEIKGGISFEKIQRDSLAIFRTPRFWVCSTAMFMGAGAEFCLTFWSAAYLRLNFDATAWQAGLGTGAIAFGMFTGRTGFGYFAKKAYLKHILLFSGLATIPISLLLVVLTPELITNRVTLFVSLFVVLYLCGIGISPYWPTMQVYGVESHPHLDSTLMYIYFSVIGTPGCGFFTWLMGIMGDRFGLRGGFLLIPSSLVLFSLVVFLEGWVFPKKTESRKTISA